MAVPSFDFRTPEERQRDHEKWVERHYLEDGKAYTFELSNTWYSGWFPAKIMTWECFVKQAFCPWMIVAHKSFNYIAATPGAGVLAKWRARKWGRKYLKRGGPPEGFFAPPPPDPNERVYRSGE